MLYTADILDQNVPSSPVGGNNDEIGQLFKLLDDFCSNGQLRNLIRVYRPTDRDYPLSGNREELKRSVRSLFDSHHLPRARLDDVLERAEENGRQHILLYTPTNDAVATKLNDYKFVEFAMLQGQTRAEAGLPKFQIRPMNVEIADLRSDTRHGTKYTTWTYKLYAGAERWEQFGTPVIENDVKTIRLRRRYRREVIVIKWHSFGLLELRIPIGGGRSQLQAIRNGLLNTLASVLGIENSNDQQTSTALFSFAALAGEFTAERTKPIEISEHPSGLLSLQPLRIPTKKLNDLARSKDVKWLSANATEIDADGHSLTVGSRDEDENIYDSPIVVDALKKARDCTRLGVMIHLRDQPDFPEKLNVEFCPNFANEVRIGSHTTPEAIEFAIRRVWEFADRGPLPESPVDQVASSQPDSSLSTLDFGALTRHYPSLANAIIRLQQWIEGHPSSEFLDPRRLQKALGTGLKAIDIAVVVGKLVEAGVLQQRYKVRPANRRSYLSQTFDSIDELLDSDIKDDNGEVVELKDADVVTVYGKAAG